MEKKTIWIYLEYFSNSKNLAYNSRAYLGLIYGETGEASQIGSEKMRSVVTAHIGMGEKQMYTVEEIQQFSLASQVSSH